MHMPAVYKYISKKWPNDRRINENKKKDKTIHFFFNDLRSQFVYMYIDTSTHMPTIAEERLAHRNSHS